MAGAIAPWNASMEKMTDLKLLPQCVPENPNYQGFAGKGAVTQNGSSFSGVVSVSLTFQKALLNVVQQISSISLRQLKSSESCILFEISLEMREAMREYQDTVHLICETSGVKWAAYRIITGPSRCSFPKHMSKA